LSDPVNILTVAKVVHINFIDELQNITYLIDLLIKIQSGLYFAYNAVEMNSVNFTVQEKNDFAAFD